VERIDVTRHPRCRGEGVERGAAGDIRLSVGHATARDQTEDGELERRKSHRRTSSASWKDCRLSLVAIASRTRSASAVVAGW